MPNSDPYIEAAWLMARKVGLGCNICLMALGNRPIALPASPRNLKCATSTAKEPQIDLNMAAQNLS